MKRLASLWNARNSAVQHACIPCYGPVSATKAARLRNIVGSGTETIDDVSSNTPTAAHVLEEQLKTELRQRLTALMISVSFELAFTLNNGEGIRFNGKEFKFWSPLREQLRHETHHAGVAAMQSLPDTLAKMQQLLLHLHKVKTNNFQFSRLTT